MAQQVKDLPAVQETRRCGFDPWVGKIPWRRKWQPTPAFLPGKSLGQKSQMGDGPWGHKRNTTEQINKNNKASLETFFQFQFLYSLEFNLGSKDKPCSLKMRVSNELWFTLRLLYLNIQIAGRTTQWHLCSTVYVTEQGRVRTHALQGCVKRGFVFWLPLWLCW